MGPAADAIAAESAAAAAAAVQALRAADGGRAAILHTAEHSDVAPRPDLPGSATWIADNVHCPESLRTAVDALLDRVAVVDSLDAATELVCRQPSLRAVTRDGDLVGTGWVTGGSDRRPSTLEVQAAIDASTSALEAAERRSEELAAALAGALAEQADRAEVAEQALAALHESDANMSAVYEQLGRLGHVVRAAHAESERLLAQRAKAESGREETLAALAELEERLRRAEDEQSGAAADSGSTAPTDFEREAAAAALTEVRAVEVEARLAVRTAEERAESVRGKADSLRRAAQAEREARARAERARQARRTAAEVAAAVASAGQKVADRLDRVVADAVAHRDELSRLRAAHTEQVEAVKERVRQLTAQMAALTDAVHRDEVARAQAALRIEQLEQTILEQYAVNLDDLIAEYGPDVALPPSELEIAEYEQARERGEQVTRPAPVRTTAPPGAPGQARREGPGDARQGQPARARGVRGARGAVQLPVHQLEDVKNARKDLLGVVADVDARILQMFTEAYADVEREFVEVFAKTLPGRRGPSGAHRPVGHAHHPASRWRPGAGQEGQAAVAAVRWREVAHRGRDAGRDLPGPAVAVLRHGRGGGRARRHEPAAPDRVVRAVAGEVAADRDHPPEADDGGRRRALRRQHARRRHHHRHLAAPARSGPGCRVNPAPSFTCVHPARPHRTTWENHR